MSHKLDVRIRQLPPALAVTLRQATRRIRRILFLRGLLAVAATALIALLVIMAVDAAVVIYNPAIRWGLSLAGLAAVLWVAARMLIGPLSQRFSPSRIAALIEQRHPELEERLSTVVELMAMPETFGRGSEQLVALITEAAEADARHVTPKREFTGRTVKPKLVAAAVATVILGTLFAMFPQHASLLALRALAPFAEIDNVFAKNLNVTPGSAIVLLGEPLEVELSVVNAFTGQPYLRRQLSKGWRRWGYEITERMRQVPSDDEAMRQYSQMFPSVEQSFRYRVSCGHALTRRYSVTAVPRPFAEIGSVRYVYPAYTGKPSVTETNIPGGIAALVGTRVEITAPLNRDDIFGTFSLPPQEWPIVSNVAQQATCNFTLTKDLNAKLNILLRDGYGFTNYPVSYAVHAIPDRPPTIAFTRPEKATVRLSRNAQMAIEYLMTDDYGVANATLLISRNDEPFTQHTALRNFQKTDDETWAGAEGFNLAALDLTNVSKLRLQISVEDNLPKDLGGPQSARSGIVTIELDDGARALEVQRYQEAIKKLEEALRQIMEQMRQTERSTEEIRSAFDRKEQPNQQTQQKLDNIRQELAKTENQMQNLAEEHQDSALKELAERLEQLRQQQMEAARKAAEEAQLAALEQQPLKVRDLEKRLEDSVKSMDEMLKEAREFNKQLDKLAALDELSMREQALADTAQQAAKPEEMNDWRNQQEEVRNRLNQQIAENPEMKLDALETRRERLAQVAEEVKALSAEQQQFREQITHEQAHTLEQTARQQELAQKLADARQEVDDIRQDMYRFAPQPVHQPLEQANNNLREAQQRANEAARNLQQSQDAKNDGQQQQKHNEAVQKQQEAQNQTDNASQAIEQALQAMDRAIAEQRQKQSGQQQDTAQMNEQRDALKAMSEQAQQLAAEQAQLTQAQRQETAEKQLAEREQRPFTPSEDNAQHAQQQQQIAEQAQALDQQVEAMRNAMQQMGEAARPLQQPLQEAKNELDHAQRMANDAAQTLQNQPRQPHESLWRQEEAQRGIEKAAASLMQAERRLDQMLAQAEQQQPPDDGQQAPDTPPQSMDASDHMRDAMRDASQAQKAAEQERRAQQDPNQQPPDTPSAEQMQNAQQDAQAAADKMRQMVQKQAQRLNVPLQHLPSQAMSAQPSSKPQPRPRLELPMQMPSVLREQQMPDSEWFRLRGEISSQALEDALRKVSPEYRELVRMYFRELSKQNQ